MRCILILATLPVFAISGTTPARSQTQERPGSDEMPAARRDHRLFLVTTDLQRLLLGPKVKSIVYVDGSAVDAKDGKTVIDAIRREVSTAKDKSGTIHFRVVRRRRMQGDPPSVPLARFQAIGRDEGFEAVTADNLFSNDATTWADMLRRSASGQGVATDDPVVGDELVKVFAVQTPLSRLLTSGADCFVDLWIPDDMDVVEVRKTVAERVTKLNPKLRDRMAVRLNKAPQDDQLETVLWEWDRLAKSLQFKGSSVSF